MKINDLFTIVMIYESMLSSFFEAKNINIVIHAPRQKMLSTYQHFADTS